LTTYQLICYSFILQLFHKTSETSMIWKLSKTVVNVSHNQKQSVYAV